MSTLVKSILENVRSARIHRANFAAYEAAGDTHRASVAAEWVAYRLQLAEVAALELGGRQLSVQL